MHHTTSQRLLHVGTGSCGCHMKVEGIDGMGCIQLTFLASRMWQWSDLGDHVQGGLNMLGQRWMRHLLCVQPVMQARLVATCCPCGPVASVGIKL